VPTTTASWPLRRWTAIATHGRGSGEGRLFHGRRGLAYRDLVLELLLAGLEPLRRDEPYDFGPRDARSAWRELGQEATEYADFWHAPPTDVVYFHRKLGGMFMLAGERAHALGGAAPPSTLQHR
jgi:hypothetical protein